VTNAAADHATKDLIDALVKEMKKTGRFTLPSLGTFIARKTEGTEGTQSPDRRANQSEGRQDRPVQGIAGSEKAV
jgi:hypothetical protein